MTVRTAPSPEITHLHPIAADAPRPQARGKFIFVGEEKLYIRGVTYGTFRPDESGQEFCNAAVVEADFMRMAESGINAVRTYTVPPRWLLDLAHDCGLRVMVGLPWEQHITFLDDAGRARAIEESVRAGVRACAAHPAVLCYAIGNEIPAPIVRWHGARRIERFLGRLYEAAKEEDPGGLVTYVNYPSTEYLNLDFVDFLCFNVYLESRDRLDAYLARLQNIARDRPLVMAEVGLDSRRNGDFEQARVLDWQIRSVFEAGASGIFVFAWTDEWYRGGAEIEDWDFGLTDRQRQPKPALEAVRTAFGETPFPPDLRWPLISIVVCSHNGARTLEDCCQGIAEIEYPQFEAILVDDGSSDDTATIGRRYGLRVISTENRGLSSARNTGLEAASGEIVAYLDDDARPDPHWLRYLAMSFMRSDHVGIGGPNIAPAGDGRIADAVANAPGGPVHVLLTDEIAEHIPGCNMAYRASALREIGGFDPVFRAAGDDVDICWRLQDRGWTLGFSPAAMVWHHRRNSIRTYWKQQKGYGKAEALLERKWPEKYNSAGHVAWSGRVYSKGFTKALACGGRIYGGIWGTAPFQSLYERTPGTLRSMPLMPEWYLLIGMLTGLCALGAAWRPLLFTAPLLAVAIIAPLVQASLSAAQAQFTTVPLSRLERFELRALTGLLHLMQPMARLRGRLKHGLTLWRLHAPRHFTLPLPRNVAVWREEWLSPESWLLWAESQLRERGVVLYRGGEFDRWDIQVRGGALGSARIVFAVEEHGGGKQLARFRIWPRVRTSGAVLVLILALLAAEAATDEAWIAFAILGATALLVTLLMLHDCAVAIASACISLRRGVMSRTRILNEKVDL